MLQDYEGGGIGFVVDGIENGDSSNNEITCNNIPINKVNCCFSCDTVLNFTCINGFM